ncbi:MAG: hypothetical protein ACREE6_13430, partial [Limisphaerales bacterium]
MNVPSKSVLQVCRSEPARVCWNLLLAAALFSLASFNLRAATIADWKFNEADPMADSSGNGNTLVLNGTGTYTSDVDTNDPGATNSITFDGATYLQTTTTLDLALYNAITIEFFAKYTPSGGLEMFYAQNNPNNVTG